MIRRHALKPVLTRHFRQEARDLGLGLPSSLYACRCGARLHARYDTDAWSLAGQNAYCLMADVPGRGQRRLQWAIVPEADVDPLGLDDAARTRHAIGQVALALALAVQEGCPAAAARG